MHRMRASCQSCGDIELDAAEFEVGGHAQSTPGYSFRCPQCGCRTERPLERPVALLLLAAGARDLDAAGPGAGVRGAVDDDDVTRFMALLDCDDAVAVEVGQLAAELRG